MKQELTIEQSQNLIMSRINSRKASSLKECGKNEKGQYRSLWWDAPNTTVGETSIEDEDLSIVQRVFTIGDLLAMLPKWIKYRYYLLYLNVWVDKYSEVWNVSYRSDMDVDEADSHQCADELIDCLYSMVGWLIDNDYGDLIKD